MKIRLLSDLHLESSPFNYKFIGEDVLVLAGDIHTLNRHEELLNQIPGEVEIMFVAGNHEYYKNEVKEVQSFLVGLDQKYENFHYLRNSGRTIGDVAFFGGTMYTDFRLGRFDPLAEFNASRGINDFRITKIDDGGLWRKWTPEDHKKEHREFCHQLKDWAVGRKGKRVVISHFVPHELAIASQWKESELNAYFTADMSKYMGWKGLWLYGHTHNSADFMVGETRVVGNPKGYGKENQREFNPNLILEI